MPTTIPGTSRQKVTTRFGVDLQRQYVFMSAESWSLLQTLCTAAHKSNSQVIEQLVQNAARGNQKEESNDAATFSKN